MQVGRLRPGKNRKLRRAVRRSRPERFAVRRLHRRWPAAAAGAWPEASWLNAADLEPAEGSGVRAQRLVLALLASTVALLYAPIAWGTLGDCWRDSNYSHGVLVPAIVLGLVWQRRHDLAAWRDRDARRGRLLAWGALVSGGLFFVFGAAAAEQFTMRISGVLVLLGLCGLLGGARALRRYGLPLALLACMVPLPYTFYYAVSFPLQLLSARLAAGGMDLLGFAVTRHGNVFEVNGQALEVIGACSGVRSLMALGTLAAAGAVALRLGLVRSLLLVLVTAPVAMLGNTLRLMATAILVARFGPRAAEGAWHESVGVVSFVAALALLGLVARSMHGPRAGTRDGKRPAATGASRPAGCTPAAGPAVGRRIPVQLQPGRAWAWVVSLRPVSARRAWVGLALLVLCGGYGTFLRLHTAGPGTTPDFSRFPLRFDTLEGRDIPLDRRVREAVQADAYIFRAYGGPGTPEIGLYVGYYRDPRQGAQIHSPLHCYPGAGWEIEDSEPLAVRDLDGRMTGLRRLVVERDGRRDVVVYWYETRTGRRTGDLQLKFDLMRTALLHEPQDAAFVRWSTSVAEGEDLEAATIRLLTVAAHAAPRLQAVLPFGS